MTSRRTILLGLAGTLALGGCARIGASRFNPLNWFGGSAEEEGVAPVETPADPRPLVDVITALTIEPTPTGAIVLATGLPPMQGWHSAELVPQSDGPVGGEMVYAFRAVPPETPSRISTAASRELSVGARLSTQDLAATRVIRVVGARNARAVRR